MTDLWRGLCLWWYKRAAQRRAQQRIVQFTSADYAASHSLPPVDVQPWPPLDLDTPPYLTRADYDWRKSVFTHMEENEE